MERGRPPERRVTLGLRELGFRDQDHQCHRQPLLLDGAVLAALALGRARGAGYLPLRVYLADACWYVVSSEAEFWGNADVMG